MTRIKIEKTVTFSTKGNKLQNCMAKWELGHHFVSEAKLFSRIVFYSFDSNLLSLNIKIQLSKSEAVFLVVCDPSVNEL